MNEAIYQALCSCLGLVPSADEAVALIREAYQEPENAPRPPRHTDVIYFHVEPDTSTSEDPPGILAENAGESLYAAAVSNFAAWRLLIICYGPHALAYARDIRSFIYLDGYNMPRCILRKAGIRPVPEPPEPILLHEPEGSLWRLRCDLTIELRREEKHTHSSRQNAIGIAPAIVVRTGDTRG